MVSARGPSQPSELDAFERRHGIHLPASYRAYMCTVGSGTPEPNHYIDEVRGLFLYVGLVFALDDPLMWDQSFPFPPPAECGLLPVATSGGGDYFVVKLDSGDVYYWDHERDDARATAEDLAWLASSLPALVGSLVFPPGHGPQEVDAIEALGRDGDIQAVENFVRLRGVDARNSAGRSIAEEAARYGNLPVMRRCLELGAASRSLLHWAAAGDNLELIGFLLEHGSDINATNDAGHSPLDRAIARETYEYLAGRGAKHVRRQRPPHLR